jgi:hypothetical protein
LTTNWAVTLRALITSGSTPISVDGPKWKISRALLSWAGSTLMRVGFFFLLRTGMVIGAPV